MRKVVQRLRVATVGAAGAAVSSGQGVIGAGLVIAGVGRLSGVSWALMAAGAFLLAGAWSRR